MPVAIPIAMGVSAAASAYGAHKAASSATNAAQIQAGSADKSLALQQQMYNTAQSQYAPYRAIGADAAGQIGSLYGTNGTDTLNLPTFNYGSFGGVDYNSIKNDPAYQLTQKEAQDSVQKSAAAHGTLLNTNTMNKLQDRSAAVAGQYENDMFNRALSGYQANAANAYNAYQSQYNKASTESNTQFTRLMSLLGVGQQATAQGAGLGQNYANEASNLYGQQGNALASGEVGSGNAWNQGLGNVANLAQLYALMQYKQPK
jgi:hypothetical protein